jgi:hypothetical protein
LCRQEQYNALYEGSEFDIETRYALLLNAMFVTLLFSAGLPILIAFAAFNFVSQNPKEGEEEEDDDDEEEEEEEEEKEGKDNAHHDDDEVGSPSAANNVRRLVCGQILTFVVDKYFLLKFYSTPPMYDGSLAMMVSDILPWAFVVHLAMSSWMLSSDELLPSGELRLGCESFRRFRTVDCGA